MQLALMFVNNPYGYLEGRILFPNDKGSILNVISNLFCHRTQQVTFSEYKKRCIGFTVNVKIVEIVEDSQLLKGNYLDLQFLYNDHHKKTNKTKQKSH